MTVEINKKIIQESIDCGDINIPNPDEQIILKKDSCFLIDSSGYMEELQEGKHFFIGSGR